MKVEGSPRRKWPLWLKIVVPLGVVLVLGSGGAFAAVKVAENKVNAAIPDHQLGGSAAAPVQHADIKGAKNILLASLDTRPSWTKTHQPSHTDSIIILHVTADHKSAYMLSIPRDLLVDIPKYNNGKYLNREHHDKINAAFAFGSMGLDGDDATTQGMTLLAETVQKQFGIKPDAAAVVNYDGFVDILKQIKKVCLYVDENVTSIHIGHTKDGKLAVPFKTTAAGTNPRHLYVDGEQVIPNTYKIGNQCLDPTQALDFARQRDLLSPLHDGDYGRQRHQQQLLKAILKTAVSQGLDSPTKLPGLLTAVGKAMTVFRQGISLEDWVFGMRNLNPDDIVTLKTNGGKFHEVPSGVGSSEGLTADSVAMFKAAKDDTLEAFVQTHPTWVAKT
ncbi:MULTISPECIES: LCP family protein [unclassified Actinoplanes]|uniref:LCP family protein n=1 Tax=unclassified Actinoplanes TaxID=2626549 RepID=UPI0002E6EB5B|nr:MULTISPECIES: LCP family protein [unclassified Actinoplanes]